MTESESWRFTDWDILNPPVAMGSVPERVAAWYPAFGGLATGLAILTTYVKSSEPSASVRSPRWFAIRPVSPAGPYSTATPPPNFSAAVKYSGLAESFSVHAGRGKQSSTGQRLSAIHHQDAECVLEALWSNRPDGTLTLVLQELVDITRPGALFHAYSRGGVLTVELIGKSGRSLLVYDNGGMEPAYIEHLPGGSAGVDPRECRRLAGELQHLLIHVAQLGDAFNVEGFVDSHAEQTWMFQFRPVPADRPNDMVTVRRSTEDPSIYRTRYTWGAFDEVVGLDGSDEPAIGVFWRTRSNFDTVTDQIQQQLRDGRRVLLVDTADGFRLSHEPWNLPEPSIRAGYRYMHFPLSLVDTVGKTPIRLFGDGDMACVKAPVEED